MLKRLRESLVLVLVALLPLHALLVTVSTRVIDGIYKAPLLGVALWKEGIVAVVVLLALIELLQAKKWRSLFAWDKLDILAGLFIVVSVLVSLVVAAGPKAMFFGVRYDIVPLLLFLLLRRVEWSDVFIKRVLYAIIGGSLLIVLYGIATFFLPHKFFLWLGYADLHSLYIPSRSLPPFHLIDSLGLRRVQSTFSGPNQFGMWLLLPWGISLVGIFLATWKIRLRWFALLGATGVALLFTFSRAAVLSAGVCGVLAAGMFLPKGFARKVIGGICVLGALALATILLTAPQVLLRSISSKAHIERPLEAISSIASYPFGQGLGSAGPASNRLSDACMHLPEAQDLSWAEAHPALCVFVDGEQRLPLDRTCNCPFLPENWYLQLGVEAGVLGMTLFIMFMALLLWKLHRSIAITGDNWHLDDRYVLRATVFFLFLGVSIASLFLHAWEDSAVAYTGWMLLGAVVPWLKK